MLLPSDTLYLLLKLCGSWLQHFFTLYYMFSKKWWVMNIAEQSQGIAAPIPCFCALV